MLKTITPDAAITTPGATVAFKFAPGTCVDARTAVVERIKGWKNVATAGAVFPEATNDTDGRLYFVKVNVEGAKWRVLKDLKNIDEVSEVEPRLSQGALTALTVAADAVRVAGDQINTAAGVAREKVNSAAGVVSERVSTAVGVARIGLSIAGAVAADKVGQGLTFLRKGAAKLSRAAADLVDVKDEDGEKPAEQNS